MIRQWAGGDVQRLQLMADDIWGILIVKMVGAGKTIVISTISDSGNTLTRVSMAWFHLLREQRSFGGQTDEPQRLRVCTH